MAFSISTNGYLEKSRNGRRSWVATILAWRESFERTLKELENDPNLRQKVYQRREEVKLRKLRHAEQPHVVYAPEIFRQYPPHELPKNFRFPQSVAQMLIKTARDKEENRLWREAWAEHLDERQTRQADYDRSDMRGFGLPSDQLDQLYSDVVAESENQPTKEFSETLLADDSPIRPKFPLLTAMTILFAERQKALLVADNAIIQRICLRRSIRIITGAQFFKLDGINAEYKLTTDKKN